MPDRIRVAQLISTFQMEKGGGGITRVAITLAEKLSPAKIESIVISLEETGSESERQWLKQLNNQGIRAFAASQVEENRPYRNFIKAYRGLYNEFKHRPIDILHSHSEFTDVAVVFLKLQNRVPCIIRTTHYGYHKEWRTKPLRRAVFTNFLYPLLFNAEIGVSLSLQNRLNQRWLAHLLRRQAMFINASVHLDRFQGVQINIAEKKESLGIPSDALLVGSVGRLVEQKGFIYLLEAAKLVIESEPRTYFLIVGDGPLYDELYSKAARMGILNQVIFAGGRSDVEELLACMDLFALASLWEGMPGSVLESMASGIPVLATDIPGTSDLIKHGNNGWLVPARDSREMAIAIIFLLASPGIRTELATNAKAFIPNFSIDVVAKRYEALYETLYTGHRF